MTTFSDPDTTAVGPRPPATVMRGPANADNYRIKVGRYKERWYIDPLPYDADHHEALADEAHPSVSTIKSAASGKDWTFVALRRVAHADDLDQIAGLGFFERYERLKVLNKLDLSAAQRRGTNVHLRAESIAYGLPAPSLGPDGAAYFGTVDRLFAELKPELVAAEFVCIHRSLHGVGYGGTADGIFVIDGKRYMIDWKSRGEDSDHGAYPEEAAQLGAYLGAEYVIVEDTDPSNPHGAKRVPVPEVDGALVVSIKPDSYEVYPVAVDHAIEMFHAMHLWWMARREESKVIGRKWAPRQTVPLADQLQDSLDALSPENKAMVERRIALYDRHDKLTLEQKEDFAARVGTIDTDDLDAVEALMDDLTDTATILDMAQRRMARDAEREADRRLAAQGMEPATTVDEGGPASQDDINEYESRWELSMSDAGRRWLGSVVQEAIEAGVDFRLSAHNSQRRADLFCALTEFASLDLMRTAMAEKHLHAAITAASGRAPDGSIGFRIGGLDLGEAATLRHVVTEVGAGRMTYVVDADGLPRWSSK